jgi:pimeloyl-ACP methyl ester carboxylesterase
MSWRDEVRKAGLAILSVAAVIALGGWKPLRHMGSKAIAVSPNQGMPLPAATPDELQIPVGPPAATLSVKLVEPAGEARGTVMVLHGIRDRADSMRGWATMLARAGYRAVLVDIRGHGRSTGDTMSYGVIESRDIMQVADALEAKGITLGPLGAFGVSYGAATAIQWAGVDPRVRAVVAIAPFASLRTVITPGYAPSFLPASFVQGAIDDAGKMGAFDPDEASAVTAITRTRAHVLLIHGRQDPRIPVAHSERIHAAAPDHSELVIVEGADHDNIGSVAGTLIQARAPEWFSRW